VTCVYFSRFWVLGDDEGDSESTEEYEPEQNVKPKSAVSTSYIAILYIRLFGPVESFPLCHCVSYM